MAGIAGLGQISRRMENKAVLRNDQDPFCAAPFSHQQTLIHTFHAERPVVSLQEDPVSQKIFREVFIVNVAEPDLFYNGLWVLLLQQMGDEQVADPAWAIKEISSSKVFHDALHFNLSLFLRAAGQSIANHLDNPCQVQGKQDYFQS